MKNDNIEAIIVKIGLQSEKVRKKREAADVEAQKVRLLLVFLIHCCGITHGITYHTVAYVEHLQM